MTLHDFIKIKGWSTARLAEEIGVSYEAARLYLLGKRTPRPRVMRRIHEVSDGLVTPNDILAGLAPSGEAAA